MAKQSKLRNFFLWSMIAFFVTGGVLSAGFFLFGSFGETQARILGTVFSLGVFSLLGMVSAGRLSTKGAQGFLARLGVGASVLAAALLQPLIWELWDYSDGIFKTIAVVSIISFAVAHALLVWGKARNTLTQSVMWSTLGLILIVSSMLIFVILSEFDVGEAFWRVFGFMAVLDVVGTIVTPLMRKLKG